jgi:uncharacterized protein YfiM (DUF2279 family)
MRGLALVFALHMPPEHAGGDRWFSADKAKHFFTAAFIQSLSFSALRSTGIGKSGSLAGATIVAAGVSVGKELYDQRSHGDPSLKDLTWDGAGMLAASVLLGQTER